MDDAEIKKYVADTKKKYVAMDEGSIPNKDYALCIVKGCSRETTVGQIEGCSWRKLINPQFQDTKVFVRACGAVRSIDLWWPKDEEIWPE